MKLKQTKKKLFLTSSILVFCICLGFVIRKSINVKTYADNSSESASNVIQYYTTEEIQTMSNVTMLVDKTQYFEKGLKNWSWFPKDFSVEVVDAERNIVGPVEPAKDYVKDFKGEWEEGYKRVTNNTLPEYISRMYPIKYLKIAGNTTHKYECDENDRNCPSWVVETENNGEIYRTKISVKELTNTGSNESAFIVLESANEFSLDQVYSRECQYAKNEGGTPTTYKKNPQGEFVPCTGNDVIVPYSYEAGWNDDYRGIFATLEYTIENGPKRTYLEIGDIDYGQSYRIENKGIYNYDDATQTEEWNIYRRVDENTFKRNEFSGSTENNYIYLDNNNNINIFSSIKLGNTFGDRKLFATNNNTNIFLRLSDPDASSNTRKMEVVYGFRYCAGSNTNLYAETFNVEYQAFDENNQSIGNIFQYNGTDPVEGESVNTEIYAEDTIGLLPTIASSRQGRYKINYWTTNKDITVNGVTYYTDTSHITPDQMSLLAQSFAIEDDYTFTAHLALINYTITFKNDDGSEISKKTDYHYGDAITVPANPTKPSSTSEPGYDYAFNSWSPALPSPRTVTDSVTYTATYTATIQQYLVTFKNWNDSVLQSTNYNYGTTPSYNGTPTRPADNTYTYNFTGWDKQIVPVTGAATYKAQYEPKFINYTITFYDEDEETILLTKSDYHYNDEIITPSPAPTKPSTAQYQYTFSGYEPIGDSPELTAHSTVTRDAEYRATYVEETRKYPIKFIDDDKIIEEQEVEYGETPDAPDVPIEKVVENCTYKFAGWDPEIETVTGEATYKATYAKVSCTEVPNTGGNDKTILGGATKNTSIALPFIIASAVVAITSTIFYRLYRRSKTMKF